MAKNVKAAKKQKMAENGQKRPKTAKNGQKCMETAKNTKYGRRAETELTAKWAKIAKNGEKR